MIGTILAAAGTGSRFASTVPKQFLQIEDRPIYRHALDRLLPISHQVVVVVASSQLVPVNDQLQSLAEGASITVVEGGATRQDSVGNGLKALDDEIDWVLVHDAARPFISPQLIARVLRGAAESGACIPAIPVAETVKEVSDRRVRRTLDRSRLVLVQTPQAFRRDLLETAFEWASQTGFQGTDEASLIEELKKEVSWVEGESWNIKITHPGDLEKGSALWQNRVDSGFEESGSGGPPY